MSAHERERLSAFLDGELTPAERAEVEAHLAACPACAALLARMGEVDDVARELPVEAPSGYFDSFPGRVRARIEAEGTPSARRTRPQARWRLPVWTWAAAAVLVLAVLTPMTIPNLMRARVPTSEAPAAPAAKARPQVVETLPERAVTTAGDGEADTAPQRRRGASMGRSDRDDRVAEAEPPFAPPPPPAPAPPAAAAPRPGLGAGKQDTPAVGAPPVAENRPRELAKDAPTFAVDPSEGEAFEEATVAGVAGRERAMADLKSSPAAPEPVTGGVSSASMRAEAAQAPAGGVAAPEAESRADRAAAEKKPQLSGGDALAFGELSRDVPRSATAWRERREAWRTFIAEHPQSPRLDEAWVRMIEAGVEAWTAGGDPGDYTQARADADAYLDRDGASQKGRIRRLVEEAEKR